MFLFMSLIFRGIKSLIFNVYFSLFNRFHAIKEPTNPTIKQFGEEKLSNFKRFVEMLQKKYDMQIDHISSLQRLSFPRLLLLLNKHQSMKAKVLDKIPKQFDDTESDKLRRYIELFFKLAE